MLLTLTEFPNNFSFRSIYTNSNNLALFKCKFMSHFQIIWTKAIISIRENIILKLEIFLASAFPIPNSNLNMESHFINFYLEFIKVFYDLFAKNIGNCLCNYLFLIEEQFWINITFWINPVFSINWEKRSWRFFKFLYLYLFLWSLVLRNVHNIPYINFLDKLWYIGKLVKIRVDLFLYLFYLLF